MGNDRLKPRINLRRASLSDCRRLWRWRNEAEVRKFSFNKERIPYGVHKQWFADKLDSPRTQILVGEKESGEPIGQVRFDLSKNGVAKAHILIKKSERNKGFGQSLLRGACNYGFSRLKLKRVWAYAQLKNGRSVRLFKKVGFQKRKKVTVNHQPTVLMELKNER